MSTTTPSKKNTELFKPTAEWPGSFSLFGKAVKSVKDNIDFAYLFVGILGIFAVLDYVFKPTPFFSFDISSGSSQSETGLAIAVISALVGLILTAPLTVYQLRLAAGKEASVSAVMKTGLSRIFPFIGLNLLVLAAIFVGLILLILPGLYIAFRLIAANYAFFDKNLDPVDAMKESLAITKGNLGEVAGYIGLIILLSLVTGMLSLVIPVFGNMLANFAVVVYGVVGAWLYRWLSKQATVAQRKSA